MSEDDAKKSRKNFEEIAKKRIKVGLILNKSFRTRITNRSSKTN